MEVVAPQLFVCSLPKLLVLYGLVLFVAPFVIRLILLVFRPVLLSFRGSAGIRFALLVLFIGGRFFIFRRSEL